MVGEKIFTCFWGVGYQAQLKPDVDCFVPCTLHARLSSKWIIYIVNELLTMAVWL